MPPRPVRRPQKAGPAEIASKHPKREEERNYPAAEDCKHGLEMLGFKKKRRNDNMISVVGISSVCGRHRGRECRLSTHRGPRLLRAPVRDGQLLRLSRRQPLFVLAFETSTEPGRIELVDEGGVIELLWLEGLHRRVLIGKNVAEQFHFRGNDRSRIGAK